MVSKKALRTGPKGLAPEEIVAAAVQLREAVGEAGFSVRKLAARMGCDPMAVLYHFQSKAGLERAMADTLNGLLQPVDGGAHWRERLRDLAHQYRNLALQYPHTFPLLLHFWVTGPADYRQAEAIYQALSDAGLDDRQVVDMCFGWYASLLGMAAAEIGGLLQPAPAAFLREVAELPPEQFPVTTRLQPVFARQQPGRVYTLMVETLLDGIQRALPD